MTPDDSEILTRLAGQSPREWVTDGTTLLFLLMLVGRIWHALQSGGGIVGAWRALLYGTNTPHKPEETRPDAH